MLSPQYVSKANGLQRLSGVDLSSTAVKFPPGPSNPDATDPLADGLRFSGI
jgi:hypothetical protein